MKDIAIVIPSLNPTEQLVGFIQRLRTICAGYPVIVVDDGSQESCRPVFDAVERDGVRLLRHAVNQGKGRALKTAFNDYLLHGGTTGIVTADADGQHLPEDILKCIREFEAHPTDLILGVRNFAKDNVPWKSRYGNLLTVGGMVLLAGMLIHDTQTGLRGIPMALMCELMKRASGERFEFETVMLLRSKTLEPVCRIREVEIETVYANDNRETHFRPIVDSYRIYKILFANFIRKFALFLLSSVLAAVLDQGVFAFLYYKIFPVVMTDGPVLLTAVVVARICSLLFNYGVNRKIVFANKGKTFEKTSFGKYLGLCCMVLLLSYGLLKAVVGLYPTIHVWSAKIVIDIFLFVSNYYIQKNWCFRDNGQRS